MLTFTQICNTNNIPVTLQHPEKKKIHVNSSHFSWNNKITAVVVSESLCRSKQPKLIFALQYLSDSKQKLWNMGWTKKCLNKSTLSSQRDVWKLEWMMSERWLLQSRISDRSAGKILHSEKIKFIHSFSTYWYKPSGMNQTHRR